MSDLLGFVDVPEARPVLDRGLVEVARARRQQRDRIVVSSPSVTVAMLAEGRGCTRNAARQWLHRYRSAGRLVTIDRPSGTLIPTFQLDDDLELRDDVAGLTARMVDADMSSWAIWTWWTTPNGFLDHVPIEVADEGRSDQVTAALDRLLDDWR